MNESLKNHSLDISVIIPAYNAENTLEICVKSICEQKTKYSYELIIINDCSTDNTFDICNQLRNQYAQITIINNKTNLKAGGSRNEGLKIAKGDIVIFADADVKVDDNWINNYYELHKKYPHIAGIGGYVKVELNKAYVIADYFLTLSKYFPSNQVIYTDTLPGANASFKSCYIDGILFNNEYGMEDTFFCWEVINRGGKIMLHPSVPVTHFPDRNSFRKYIIPQKRYARAYVLGYDHYNLKKITIDYPILNFFLPRIPLILSRIIKSNLLGYFIMVLPLIIIGEHYRSFWVYKYSRDFLNNIPQVPKKDE